MSASYDALTNTLTIRPVSYTYTPPPDPSMSPYDGVLRMVVDQADVDGIADTLRITPRAPTGAPIVNLARSTVADGRIIISWSAVTGAASFDVDWQTGAEEWTRLRSALAATTTSYNGTPGTVYAFRVRSRTQAGTPSNWSRVRRIQARLLPPGRIGGITLSRDRATWQASANATGYGYVFTYPGGVMRTGTTAGRVVAVERPAGVAAGSSYAFAVTPLRTGAPDGPASFADWTSTGGGTSRFGGSIGDDGGADTAGVDPSNVSVAEAVASALQTGDMSGIRALDADEARSAAAVARNVAVQAEAVAEADDERSRTVANVLDSRANAIESIAASMDDDDGEGGDDIPGYGDPSCGDSPSDPPCACGDDAFCQ